MKKFNVNNVVILVKRPKKRDLKKKDNILYIFHKQCLCKEYL